MVGNRPRTIDDDLEILFEDLKDKPDECGSGKQVANGCMQQSALYYRAMAGFKNLGGWFPVLKIKPNGYEMGNRRSIVGCPMGTLTRGNTSSGIVN